MNSTIKVIRSQVGLYRLGVSKIALFLVGVTIGIVGVCQRATAQQEADGFLPANCPPEARQIPQTCKQVEMIAYALAIRKKGYMNANGNNIPDVMERRYVINRNDCSTGNAHAACMFNDPCTAPFGRLMGLRSNSARHATTMFVGNNGRKFECDFTPQSSGIMIAHRPDTRIGPAFPDPGESMDPAYNCTMNGANTQPLNPFGGGGGGGSAMQMAIMALLMQMFQQQFAQLTPSPVPTAGNILVTPTPTPQVAPTSAALTENQGDTRRSKAALDAMDIPADDTLLGSDGVSDENETLDDVDDESVDVPERESGVDKTRSVWDRNSADIFDSGNS
jgi:hypothetical protein